MNHEGHEGSRRKSLLPSFVRQFAKVVRLQFLLRTEACGQDDERKSLNHEGHEGSRRKSLLPSFVRQFAKVVTLQLLRGYKWAISPLFLPACRYVPSCSEYAIEAVERYGAVRGGLMALWRLLRCHPFAHGGYDPVVKQRENPRPSTSSGQDFSQTTRETGHPAVL